MCSRTYVVCVHLMCATRVHLCADVVILGRPNDGQCETQEGFRGHPTELCW